MAAWVASHAPECTELTVEGDRGFESTSLQRRVHCEPDFLNQGAEINGIEIGLGAIELRRRDFAAWIGLVPRQSSTGDKTGLSGSSKRGNGSLRRLLVSADFRNRKFLKALGFPRTRRFPRFPISIRTCQLFWPAMVTKVLTDWAP